MKRCRFGLGLLLVLFILGAVSAWHLVGRMEPMAEAIDRAGAAALDAEWDLAEEIAWTVQADWENRFPFFASLTDHEPMENINGLFAQLEVYGKSRDGQNFAAVCALLARDLEAMGEAHSLKWWNVF